MKEVKHIVTRDRPNSYEYGKAGARLKIYFNDGKDLETQLKDLEKKGYYKKEVDY